MEVKLNDPKEIKINDKSFRIGRIPCIPGISIFTKTSSILDATSWNDIDANSLMLLLPYAEVIRDGVAYNLGDQNACILYLTTDELWTLCLEVYAYNFGFFMAGGIQKVLAPLLEARKQAEASAK